MLPKWKQRKYILVLLFWVLSLYDVNEREVWSMALNDNIKKFREEKISLNNNLQISYMFQGRQFVVGKMVQDVRT
jgi:predicted DNA-binding protein YlxM (UPF0122 family)